MESYDEIPVENEISIINIPLKIDRNELQRQLNAQLTGDIYSDMNTKDDGMIVKATKREDITIEINDKEIFYKVPLNLFIQKDIKITYAEAVGSLDLIFKTSYELYNDWKINTKTEVQDYHWTKKPVLKLGFVKVPIESIANMVVERAKTQVAQTIDQQVKQNLNLKEQISQVWQQLHVPMMVNQEYKTWLLPNPKSLALTPIKIDKDTIRTKIQVQVNPQIFVGDPPATPTAAPIPDLLFTDNENDGFELRVSTEIPFKEAEQMALTNLKGYTFTQGKRSVTITDLEIYGQGNKLVIGTQTEGAYNGKIYLTGKPKFSEERNRIELENVKFDFSSKKFLLNSLSWLFKGKFKEIIQENLDFQLSENMGLMKKLIGEQLKDYPITEGVNLKGNLKELAVQKVYITTDAIRLTVAMEGNLEVNVKSQLK